jgi:hypothetical protein
MSTSKAKYKKTIVPLSSGKIEIYANPKHAAALESLMEMKLIEGAKIINLIEAVYTQGKKDGAREVFEVFDKQLEVVRKAVPHKNPGKPKKKA